MARRVLFVLNRKNFRDVILKGADTGATLQAVAALVAPAGTEVEVQDAGERVRVRIIDSRRGALADEAQSGHLTRALGQMRL